MPQEIGAWLHIGEDGQITVYTGKAEVGQNIRTSLTQVVAEELHAAPRSIRLVMADTQLTPFDMGTFGSRTTPDMSRRLRRTAAAARELLIDVAAETWKADRCAPVGRQRRRRAFQDQGNPRIRQADQGPEAHQRRSPMIPRPASPENWTIAGHSAAKVDGRAFVTGKHQYASDISAARNVARQGAAPAFVRRDPGVGRLRRGQAMPDVVVVHDGDFVGVAAPSEFLAVRALAAIKAEWKPGPPISGKNLFDDLKKRQARGRPGAGERGTRRLRPADGFDQSGFGRRGRPPRADLHRSPTSPMLRSSHARRWRSGKTASSPSGPGLNGPSGCAASSPGPSGSADDAVRVIVPDTAQGTAASIPAKRPSRRPGSPAKPANRSSSSGLARKNSPGPTSGRPASSRSRAARAATEPSPPGNSTTTIPAGRGFARSTKCPTTVTAFHPVAIALAPGLVPRARLHRESLRPRSRTWTSSLMPLQSTRWSSA